MSRDRRRARWRHRLWRCRAGDPFDQRRALARRRPRRERVSSTAPWGQTSLQHQQRMQRSRSTRAFLSTRRMACWGQESAHRAQPMQTSGMMPGRGRSSFPRYSLRRRGSQERPSRPSYMVLGLGRRKSGITARSRGTPRTSTGGGGATWKRGTAAGSRPIIRLMTQSTARGSVPAMR